MSSNVSEGPGDNIIFLDIYRQQGRSVEVGGSLVGKHTEEVAYSVKEILAQTPRKVSFLIQNLRAFREYFQDFLDFLEVGASPQEGYELFLLAFLEALKKWEADLEHLTPKDIPVFRQHFELLASLFGATSLAEALYLVEENISFIDRTDFLDPTEFPDWWWKQYVNVKMGGTEIFFLRGKNFLTGDYVGGTVLYRVYMGFRFLEDISDFFQGTPFEEDVKRFREVCEYTLKKSIERGTVNNFLLFVLNDFQNDLEFLRARQEVSEKDMADYVASLLEHLSYLQKP